MTRGNDRSDRGELGASVFGHTNDIEEASRVVEECYHGEFKSEKGVAYYWTHEIDCGKVPEYLMHYIDYQGMVRDFFINDFFSIELDNKVHVFSHY